MTRPDSAALSPAALSPAAVSPLTAPATEPQSDSSQAAPRKLASRFATPAEVVERRRQLGMDQGTFWARVGVDQSAASRYERGRPIPYAVQLLLQIAHGSERESADVVTMLRTHGVAPAPNGRARSGGRGPAYAPADLPETVRQELADRMKRAKWGYLP